MLFAEKLVHSFSDSPSFEALNVPFSVSPGFSLVLDPRDRLRGLGVKVGSACEEFEDNEEKENSDFKPGQMEPA